MDKIEANIYYINHGKIFGNENWCTFFCGRCKNNVHGNDKVCFYCGAIFKDKVAYEESKDKGE